MALEDGGRELLLLPPKQTETMSGDFVCFWPQADIRNDCAYAAAHRPSKRG